jgi:hypothetical protein
LFTRSLKERLFKTGIKYILFGALLIWVGLCQLVSASAKGDVIKKDTDKDGKIDQIAHFDKEGKITRLEIDSNADGFMDRLQYYENEQVIRIDSSG